MGVSESVEQAHEAHQEMADPWYRGTGMLILVLAVALVLVVLKEMSAQNSYVIHHIGVTNDWATYQVKNLRAGQLDSTVVVLESLPPNPQIADRIKQSQDTAARIRDNPQDGDGLEQLARHAKGHEATRAEAFHLYHYYEYTVGGLLVAIVLAAVSVVTRMRLLALGAGAFGALSCAFGLGVAAHLF